MMKLRISFLFVLVCLSSLANDAFAEVYKRVNPDGSVEFTDVPNEAGQKPVEVSPPSTYKSPRLPASNTPAAKPAFTQYESVTITSPANDATIRSNEGTLSVSVTSSPGLQGDDTFLLMMDGSKAGEGNSGKFKLSNIDRGSHTLMVQIIHEGQTLLQSQTVTVHLHRASFIQKKK